MRILVFFMILLCYNFSCEECDAAYNGRTSYIADVFPLSTIYAVGDTIEIGTSISAFIPLVNANELYNYSGQSLSVAIQAFEVQPENEVIISGMDDFDYSAIEGQLFYSPYFERQLAKAISMPCGADSCRFRLAIVPRKPGYYGLNLLPSYSGLGGCVEMHLGENQFDVSDNQFGICSAINTQRFRIQEGGPYYAHPEDEKSMYFFRVE